MRVLFHCGFHKTGTSSVQAALSAVRPMLPADVGIVLQPDIPRLCEMARALSVEPDSDLGAFETLASERLFDLGTGRALLVISAEDLGGLLPGRRGLTRYARTADLMVCLHRACVAAFGAEVEVAYYFSTRDAAPWLASLWWQNLRSTRMTLDAATFAETFQTAADLTAIVDEVRAALPVCQVHYQALEDCADQPAAPLLRLAGLDALLPHLPDARANARPQAEGIADVFLALNRSGLPDGFVRETKKSVLRKLRRMSQG
ncbi:hypothetical protein [Sagittula sp. SSi028]|uniref:hypothetical protein n=1 Tax=Sagittula sp. SSi028 TaxID=3400636 RepID=UPI003AF898FC